MKVRRRDTLFYKPPFWHRRSNLYRLFGLTILILGGIWFSTHLQAGTVQNPFEPTPTFTRKAISWIEEGQAYFAAGRLDDPTSENDAIYAYQQALASDPGNARLWAELARIQAYSSRLLSNDTDRLARLGEAEKSINQAVTLAPEDSDVLAIQAFVLDWNADPALDGLRAGKPYAADYLFKAEEAANNALRFNNENPLALAYYSEILVDQQKWDQASQYIPLAVQLGPDVMDVHRVYGQYFESIGEYTKAIDEYQKALEINPNLTFLYISIGQNYRTLGFKQPLGAQQDEYYAQARAAFGKAVAIDEQLKIKDPLPYVAIAKVYAQQGQFFAAALNAQLAVNLDPTNADLYGQLGNIYKRGRNFETSIIALKCAVRGCTPSESCDARNGCEAGDPGVQVRPLSLNPNSATYYLDYGSVLSAFAPVKPSYCPEVISVLTQLVQTYPDNDVIVRNANVGLNICQEVYAGQTQAPAAGFTPGATGQPTATQTPALTPTPAYTP
ncbi:MAG: tetratricopeptide repeat protein [Bacteroidota bacterium]